MKIGIMQPYFAPYLGYWQLMNAVDKYVLLDDVNYIKRGWVNRNRILLNGVEHLITLPIMKADAFKHINENILSDIPDNIVKTIELAYRKAPYYSEIIPLVRKILECPERNLADFLSNSIVIISQHLGISVDFYRSSEIIRDRSLRSQEMIIDIVKRLNGTVYYNAIGGRELYSHDRFAQEGIELAFVQPQLRSYTQGKNVFVPGLSIIDVMMYNEKSDISRMLTEYSLVQ